MWSELNIIPLLINCINIKLVMHLVKVLIRCTHSSIYIYIYIIYNIYIYMYIHEIRVYSIVFVVHYTNNCSHAIIFISMRFTSIFPFWKRIYVRCIRASGAGTSRRHLSYLLLKWKFRHKRLRQLFCSCNICSA